MFKKALLMILGTAMLTACSGQGSQSKADGRPAPGAASKPVTIKLYMWYNEQQDQWPLIYKAFQEKYPAIRIEAVTLGNNNSTEYLKKLDLAAATGDQLDVILFSNASDYAQRVALGMLEPLDSYMDHDGFKLQDEYMLDPSIHGKAYGIPGKKSTFLTMINKNALDEAGLRVPKDWTWDEYLSYSKQLTRGDGAAKRYGTYFHYTFPLYTQLALFNQMENSALIRTDGTSNMDNPLIRQSLEIRRQAEQTDRSATPYAEMIGQKLNYGPQYLSGKAAMILIGDFMVAQAGGTEQSPAHFKTVFAPVPKVNPDDPSTTSVTCDIMSVYAKSQHKQEAYDFIRWYSTEGIQLQGRYIPSWKKANLSQVIDKIVASSKQPELVDKESLLYVLQHQIPQRFNIPPSYESDADNAFMDEATKFLLGVQDLDTTLINAKQRVEAVLAANNSRK